MITYRLEKGAPLSILEIDTNFRELEQRLNAMEDQPITSALAIEQQEDVLIFKVDGEVISHVVLPKFQPLLKGEWKKDTPYQKGAWVHFNQALYGCQILHTSGETFEPKFWTLIFDGGRSDA
jgi:hypothetical protein